MTDLSPAASVVLDAALELWVTRDSPSSIAAATLRAAADQICMKEPLGGTDADYGVFVAHQAIHSCILSIADELEGIDNA